MNIKFKVSIALFSICALSSCQGGHEGSYDNIESTEEQIQLQDARDISAELRNDIDILLERTEGLEQAIQETNSDNCDMYIVGLSYRIKELSQNINTVSARTYELEEAVY